MEIGSSVGYRLTEQDEYPHPAEASENFNESVYINLFDHRQVMGGWFRVGYRPNEGYAEVTSCLYLPDGRVGFMYQRAAKTTNDDFSAGGLSVEIVEPFRQLNVRFQGTICLLEDPFAMADPKQAFSENPHLPCEVDLSYRGVSPMYGGEPVDEDGNVVEELPEEAFARAHYEQHMAGEGTIAVGDEQWTISGLGLRDHSWGPRYWQNIYWYRWLPMSFTEDFALMISIITRPNGKQKIGGMVLQDGEYHGVVDADLEVNYDENGYQTDLVATARTDSREYRIEGTVKSLIPLRNRRQASDGSELFTRITEGLTEYRCDGFVGYGMSEFLDQVIDGKPVGP